MDNRIAYFELLKDLPGCPAGSSFTVAQSDGEEYIFNGPIQFPAYFAAEHSDWFKPITYEQYRKAFKENFMFFGMNELGKTKEQCESAYRHFMEG